MSFFNSFIQLVTLDEIHNVGNDLNNLNNRLNDLFFNEESCFQ